MVLGGSSHENLGVLEEKVFDSCPAAKRNSLIDLVLGWGSQMMMETMWQQDKLWDEGD